MVKDRAIGMVFKIQGRDSVDGSVGGWKVKLEIQSNEDEE